MYGGLVNFFLLSLGSRCVTKGFFGGDGESFLTHPNCFSEFFFFNSFLCVPMTFFIVYRVVLSQSLPKFNHRTKNLFGVSVFGEYGKNMFCFLFPFSLYFVFMYFILYCHVTRSRFYFNRLILTPPIKLCWISFTSLRIKVFFLCVNGINSFFSFTDLIGFLCSH